MKTNSYYKLIEPDQQHERCLVFLDELGVCKGDRTGSFIFSPLVPGHSYRDLYILVFELLDEGI